MIKRHQWRGRVLYADGVAETDDPFFIVPANVPDDAPTQRISTRPTAPTQSQPIVSERPVTAAGPRRAVTFERSNLKRKTRIVRHIDPWSVFRVTLVFHFVLYLTLLLAGVLLWNVANATGTVDNVERFMESFGWDTFQFQGGELFHQAWVLGLFAVVGMTGVAVLGVTTFNLITDLVGGITMTVLEGPQEPEKVAKKPLILRQRRTSRTDHP